ncbi:hypothetical protein K490DRAFT_5556, partial [Saccharata proteae CBS 121410]
VWDWEEVNTADASESAQPPTQETTSGQGGDNPERPKARRFYRPRTCRICLETVLPTYHPPPENLPGFFHAGPSVTYDSEEGRLIRPCKCKGSSRYVHENCLQAWRHADPGYGRRNYWQCPTCGFRYRLERMNWGRIISSTAAQLVLTVSIFLMVTFMLGFVADPIINLYLDPLGTVVPFAAEDDYAYSRAADELDDGWLFHFLKGFAGLGILSFAKFLLTNPLRWMNFRIGGGGTVRTGNTGRDRLSNISWVVVAIGVATFLYGVYKAVRAWSRRTLEKAGERVVDVQGEDDDDEEDQAA